MKKSFRMFKGALAAMVSLSLTAGAAVAQDSPDPPYTEDCYKEERYDCAKPSGPIWKVAWSGVAKKWPTAHDAIKKFQISSDEMNGLIKRVDVDKEPLEKVVSGWLDANEARWQQWFQ